MANLIKSVKAFGEKATGQKINGSTLMGVMRDMGQKMTGKEIKDAFNYLFSLKPDGSVMNGTFLYSNGFKLVVDGTDCWEKGCRVESITLDGKEFEDDKIYNVGMTQNCISNTLRYFDQKIESDKQKVLSLSTFNDLARWCILMDSKITVPEKGRFIFNNFEQ